MRNPWRELLEMARVKKAVVVQLYWENSVCVFGCKCSFDYVVLFGSVSERRLVKVYGVCAEILHHIM
jgi:hypothetical protein